MTSSATETNSATETIHKTAYSLPAAWPTLMSIYQSHRTDANATAIIDTLKAHGLAVEPLGRPVDLAISWGGQTHLVEIKTPTGKLRASQQAFIARWLAPVAILRSIEDAAAFVERIKSPANHRT